MNSAEKILHWAPRIICILGILIISLFALDSFEGEQPIWQQLAAFFIHMIPSFALIALLVIAWKWEYAGGMAFIIIGLLFGVLVFNINYNRNHSIGISLGNVLMIALPFVVAGILFMTSHYIKKKKNPHQA